MFKSTCFRKVRDWAKSTATSAVLQSTAFTTPGTVLELAKMLRDSHGRMRCPFGSDFEDQCGAGCRLDSCHRIPFWLALMESHGDGYRYGTESDRHLPLVFEKVVEIITNRRECRQESTQGAPEHMVGVPDDLVRALTANPCLLYTSPSPRDRSLARMPSSA